jgi:hypothetical protein
MDQQTTLGQTSPASPATGPAIKIEDVIRAFSDEVTSLRRQLWDLQAKVSRYDRIHESIFREELDRRVRLRTRGQGPRSWRDVASIAG